MLNALAAAAAAYAAGRRRRGRGPEGLAAFTGAGRRFEYKGTYHGAEVYDDYAHHPGELQALLTTAQDPGLPAASSARSSPTPTPAPRRCSTISCEELQMPGHDGAGGDLRRPGDRTTLGISSTRSGRRRSPAPCTAPRWTQVTEELARLAQPGDMIITVGAGDIYRAGEMLLNRGDAE